MKFHNSVVCIMFLFFYLQLTYGQDWANLKGYRKVNDSVMAAHNDGMRVVFLGNSITQGWLEHHSEFFIGKNYINRGISGQTTPQLWVRFREDVINLHPKVVVILAGINDIAENTGPIPIEVVADNIKSMAELALANQIDVILCSVLPADDFPWKHGLEPAEKVVKLNQMIKTYASEKNIKYVDYFSSMKDEKHAMKKEMAFDGVHPNKEGYVLMESIVEPIINEVVQND